MKKLILFALLLLCGSAQATDLVLGFNTNYGTYATVGNGTAYYYRCQADSNGSADSTLGRLHAAFVNDTGFYAVYSDSSNNYPGHTLWISQPDSVFVNGGEAWYRGASNPSMGLSIVAGTWYWVAIGLKTNQTVRLYQSTGTTAADSCYYVYSSFSGTWTSPPTTMGGYSTQHVKADIAVHYHTAGGGPGPGGGGGSVIIRKH